MVSPSRPAPVAPNQRSTSVDAVRGLAVLGILVINVSYIAMPFFAVEDPNIWGGNDGSDLLSWYLQTIFFDGKMRGLFSMLFGVGLWMQWCKAEREGTDAQFADVWSRRCVWLMLFGVAHGYLLQWPGDILFVYGLAGLFLFPLRRLGRASLIGLAAVLLAAGIGFQVPGLIEHGRSADLYVEAIAARDGGATLGEERQQAIDHWRSEYESMPADNPMIQGLLTSMRGSWGESFSGSAEWTFYMHTENLYQRMFWDTLALMLIGIVLARSGWFAGKVRSRSYLVTIAIGYGFAAPCLGFVAHQHASSGFSPLEVGATWSQDLLFHPLRIAVGLAHASVVVLIARSAGAVILRPLSAVGRTAFSNYILQTVLCTTWFLGFGFGNYGHCSRTDQMLFVLCVWAIALVWSPLWLRFFGYGPLEWAWRSLVHWRRQPMRRS